MAYGWSRAGCVLTRGRSLAFVLLVALGAGCAPVTPDEPHTVYVTQYGLGPDKWATAWLLSHHLDPGAELEVVGQGAALPERGTPFDAPSAQIRRIGNRSAFEVAQRNASSDPALRQLTEIVHEIEINFWATGGPPQSQLVEAAFRSLQYRYGRDSVTPQCYVAFFERVYRVLQDAQQKDIPVSAERLHMSCEELAHLADERDELVPEVPIVDVLSAAAAGRRVVFVDVREADEYAEGHIPDALNIPIRDVGPDLRQRLADADYVVSYCVKDFRGFEMAKALARLGVENSVIMRPYGIKGWVALGLPVTGTKALTPAQANEALEDCLANMDDCLSRAKGTI